MFFTCNYERPRACSDFIFGSPRSALSAEDAHQILLNEPLKVFGRLRAGWQLSATAVDQYASSTVQRPSVASGEFVLRARCADRIRLIFRAL